MKRKPHTIKDKIILESTPERLNAFSDGVFAIIITIMVLELKRPSSPAFSSLLQDWRSKAYPKFNSRHVKMPWNPTFSFINIPCSLKMNKEK